jgi:hypothetical protein
LFFDRSVGVGLPLALRQIRKLPFTVVYHQEYFSQDAFDDTWMPEVGKRDWFVIGQDYRYHTKPTELFAIKEYDIGCFYLWGSEAPQWDALRIFARAYNEIMTVAVTIPRPFLYVVNHTGQVRPWDLDSSRIPFGNSPKRLPSPRGLGVSST